MEAKNIAGYIAVVNEISDPLIEEVVSKLFQSNDGKFPIKDLLETLAVKIEYSQVQTINEAIALKMGLQFLEGKFKARLYRLECADPQNSIENCIVYQTH